MLKDIADGMMGLTEPTGLTKSVTELRICFIFSPNLGRAVFQRHDREVLRILG